MVIPGFTSYDIAKDGVVTHIASGKVIKPFKCTSREYYTYLRVGLLGDDGNRHVCNIVRLLALAYLDKPDGPCTARTIDGNPLNISLSNVKWEPYAKSTRDAWKYGRYANRKPKPNLCCTNDSIELLLTVLEQFDKPVNCAELSRLLEIPYTTVRYSVMYLISIGKVEKIKGKGYRLI